MSTSEKHSNTVRQGGPGASHEDAKAPKDPRKPAAESDRDSTSDVSGGGGERDRRHSRDPERK